MIEMEYAPHFLRSVKHLPIEVQLLLEDSLQRLSENAKDSSLHAKPLVGKWKGYWSFRVGRNYRVLYRFLSSADILLYEVSDRKDVYL